MNKRVSKKLRRSSLLSILLILASLALLLPGCHKTSDITLAPSGTAAIVPSTPSATAPILSFVTAPATANIYGHDLSYFGLKLEHPHELLPGEAVPDECALPGFSNSHIAYPILLSMPQDAYAGAEITFDITVLGGEFARETGEEYGPLRYGPAYLGRDFTVGNDQVIYWYKYETDIENWAYKPEDLKDPEILENHESPSSEYFTGEKAFVDIIIRADSHIVGCMTLMFYADVDSGRYTEGSGYHRCPFYPMLLDSLSFPMQDGAYQNVPIEEVQLLMDFWKQSVQ